VGRVTSPPREAAPASPASETRKARLRAALALTIVVLVLEVAGGLASGSLALLADANHMLADVAALTLAYAATALAGRAPTTRHTVGLARAEVLAAFVNAQLLLLVCGWLLYETVRRAREPSEIRPALMILVALVGLAANLLSMRILAPERRGSLSVRAAYLELAMDAAGSFAVLAAGVGVGLGGMRWAWLDLAVSAAIAVLVLPRAIGLLRQSAHILLEGAPAQVDLGSIRRRILAVPGVEEAHDFHFWTLSSGSHSASLHVRASAESERESVLQEVQRVLSEGAGVDHATIQIETGAARGCTAANDHT
jgi:cobalt-zinc-cadmium efflux system protein